ncbi:hypothetical protein LJC19_06925 [Oxalobacter sp. OttesenSCG-928-P03]|nr:hypothetical protein [Oxalobacter sp. OttesenSCG-928-P03]
MTGLMFHWAGGRRLLRLFAFSGVLLSLGTMQGCAHTEEDMALSPGVTALLQAFPAGTIDSMEEANEVQDAVAHENAMLDYQFGLDMDACTQKFLVMHCYDETKLRLRMDRAALKPLSIEADRFKRTEKVRLRDEAMVDAEQEELGKTGEREASRRRYMEKEEMYLQEQAESEADRHSSERKASRKKYEEKQQSYVDEKAADEAAPPQVEEGAYTVREPSQLKNPDTVLTPGQRAENVREYEEKKRESERKQENVQRKTAETQAKREKRAADRTKEVKRKQKEAKD